MLNMETSDLYLMRSRSEDLGQNAGNCVSEMCNALIGSDYTPEERAARMDECERVARSEIRELERMIRELRSIFANVPHHLPRTDGVAPAREADQAGDMTAGRG